MLFKHKAIHSHEFLGSQRVEWRTFLHFHSIQKYVRPGGAAIYVEVQNVESQTVEIQIVYLKYIINT
jgi:hypothetical protein